LRWARQQVGVDRDWVAREFAVYETLFLELKKLGVGEVQIAEAAYQQLTDELGG
jgi:hypothetical protein